MAFHLGSLGFLTPFLFDNFEEKVTNVLEGNAALTLRSRLKCTLKRRQSTDATADTGHITSNGQVSQNGIGIHTSLTNGSNNRSNNSPMNFLVLNEVVVDRGPSPYLSNVDLFIDGKHVTVVQGDGLIVSTPTGSTAYGKYIYSSLTHGKSYSVFCQSSCCKDCNT